MALALASQQIDRLADTALSICDNLSRSPLGPDASVCAFPRNAPGHVESDWLPCVDSSEDFSQTFDYDSSGCYGKEFPGDASGEYGGSRCVNPLHVDSFVPNAWAIESLSNELERFGRLDSFACSAHDVTSGQQHAIWICDPQAQPLYLQGSL